MPAAVARAQASDANQAPNRARLHLFDEDPRGCGKQTRSIQDLRRGRRDARRLNYGIDTNQGTFDRVPIERIAIHFFKLGIAQANRRR